MLSSHSGSVVQVKQAWYQKRQAQIGLSYMIGKPDRVTSIIVPGAFAVLGLGLVGRALHNMYLGIEKEDQ